MTSHQRELARHALGLRRGQSVTYRNHFVAGPGHSDYDEWNAMVDLGIASVRRKNRFAGGDDIFWLTKDAAKMALNSDEKLGEEFL